MKILNSKFKILNSRSGFTLIELLVVITIIGILVTLVTVAVVPIQRKSRDAKRKAEINSLLSGINLFKADFKIYPNSTFYLGSYGGSAFDTDNPRNPNSNYAVATDIANNCNNATVGATSTFLNLNGQTIDAPGKPTIIEMDTKPLLMSPGFVSVNNFLICLRYMDRLLADPKPLTSADADKYQYRVSYDYGDVIVTSRLENDTTDTDASYMFNDTLAAAGGAPKRYYRGSGVVVRHLDDSSDVAGFFSNLSGTNVDGKYLYQCKTDSLNVAIARDNRVINEPIVSDQGVYAANPTCQNQPGGLDVIPAY